MWLTPFVNASFAQKVADVSTNALTWAFITLVVSPVSHDTRITHPLTRGFVRHDHRLRGPMLMHLCRSSGLTCL
jgi:hypothetical protein